MPRSAQRFSLTQSSGCDSLTEATWFTSPGFLVGGSVLLPCFVVLTPDPVVGEDIRETVREVLPGARVRLSTTFDEVCAALHDATGDIVTVLHAPTSELRHPELRRLLDMRKARVCAIHAPITSEVSLDWVYVPPPFTTPELSSALRRLIVGMTAGTFGWR